MRVRLLIHLINLNGELKPYQLSKMLDKTQLMMRAQRLIDLTYEHSAKDLPAIVDIYLAELPGGKDWLESRD